MLLVYSGNWSRRSLQLQDHRLGHTMQGEIAGDSKAATVFRNAGTDEGCCGELCNVKEVRTLQVAIARGNAGVHCSHVNGDIYRGLRDVRFV